MQHMVFFLGNDTACFRRVNCLFLKFMQVTTFIKTCKEQIDILQNSINDDEANSKGWLGLKADNSNADTIAHKHGVV